jgi:hypothetical protein
MVMIAQRKRGLHFTVATHRQEANVLRLKIRTQNQGLGLGLITGEARGKGSKCVAKPKNKTPNIPTPTGGSVISYI